MEGTYVHLVELVESLQSEAGLRPEELILSITIPDEAGGAGVARLLKHNLCKWVADNFMMQSRDPDVPFQAPHHIKILGTPVVIRGETDEP